MFAGFGGQGIVKAALLLAQAAGLYENKSLAKPDSYAYPFPYRLTFFDAPTPIQQKLRVMFLTHRRRTFQGTFHASPDYSLWYGWQEMQMDLAEITELAKQIERHN